MKKIVCLLIVFVSLGVIYGDSSEALMSNYSRPNFGMGGAGYPPVQANYTNDPNMGNFRVLPCGQIVSNTLTPNLSSSFASGGLNQGIR